MKRVLFTLLCTLSAFAQWPSNPSQNLLICDHNGEQALPKIAATSGGGCYIAWQDLSSGNYDIYVQRLNTDGVPQWANPCGILISDHPQDTWLTDWSMITDQGDRCILAINDIRNGSDRDITAYCIHLDGSFEWGPDGIPISDNDGFEPDPQICELGDGSILFAWQNETYINMRRVSPAGVDLWNPPIIEFTQADGVSIPRVSACDSTGWASDGFVISYLAQQGTQFSSPRHLYLRKFFVEGNPLGNPNGIPIMTTNGIGIQMRPDVICDGESGAYSFWYDARGNVHHCYVQHVTWNGTVEWTVNGVQIDASPSELQMSPSAVNTGDGIVIFYQSSNTNQSQGGVQAQYLNTSGQAQWNANGVVIAPLAAEPCFNVKAYVQNGNYSVFYSQYAPGSQINTLLRASQLGEAGQSTWTPAIKELCTVVSEKGRPYTCMNPLNQIIAAWPDARDGDMDLYVQNINSSGSLGPLVDLPPSISITTPTEGAVVHDDIVSLVFDVDHFDIAEEGGDGHVILAVSPPRFGMPMNFDLFNEDPVEISLDTAGVYHFDIFLVDNDGTPLDPMVMDTLNINYVPLNPSITITWPTQPPDTLEWYDDNPPYFQFIVEDFVVADSGGDGRIHLQVRDFWRNEEPFESSFHVVFDSIEVPLWYFTTNEIVLSLVDYDGNQLVPPIADTVFVRAWQVSADPIPGGIPTEFSIANTYPNPFNSTLSIQYDVPTPAHVSLSVYDLTGRQVATLVNGVQPSGSHTTSWQADSFPSGLYFLNLRSGSHSESRKIVLLK